MLKKKNYVYAAQDLIVPAHLNFGKYMLECCSQFKENVALINGISDVKMTYGEFIQRTVNIAVSLSKIGVSKGDVVAFCGGKCDLDVILGIICAGAAYTPIYVNSGRANIIHYLQVSKPKFAIISNEFWNNYKDIVQPMDFIKTCIAFDDIPEFEYKFEKFFETNVDPESFEPVAVKGQTDSMCILYSSGTTGMPKGIRITHLSGISTCAPHDCFSDKSLQTYICSGMFTHNYDLFITYKCLAAGKTMAYYAEFNNDKFLACIEKYKVQMMFTVPAQITPIAKSTCIDNYDISSLKYIYSRSAPLHSEIIDILKKRIPSLIHLYQGYGMTEAGEPTTEARAKLGPRNGSVGVPCPNSIIKIVDTKTNKVLGPKEIGEIRLTSNQPSFMGGYIGIEPDKYLDEEGFYKTGDLGYYDEDNYFYIVGRIKEIINCKGFELPPLQMETLLLKHPSVREAAVIGVPDPELPGLELPAACIVKQSDVTAKELADIIDSEMPFYAALQDRVYFLDAIPRNTRGKVLRPQLRDIIVSKFKSITIV